MPIINFDANQVEPSAGRDPIPAGKYVAAITASEMKPTKNGTGAYLELEYQVLDGEHKGRKLWSRHTLQHPSAQTVQIARGELSAICRAIATMAFFLAALLAFTLPSTGHHFLTSLQSGCHITNRQASSISAVRRRTLPCLVMGSRCRLLPLALTPPHSPV